VPLRGHENSDSGEETPVPALLLGRGCSSTPSSRIGPGASTRGISAISFGNQYIGYLAKRKKDGKSDSTRRREGRVLWAEEFYHWAAL